MQRICLSADKTPTTNKMTRYKQKHEQAMKAQGAGRSTSAQTHSVEIPDSMAMCNDTLASNDPFSQIVDLVVEHMSRTLGPALLRRSTMVPKRNTALRSFLERNRYPERGAEYGTPFYSYLT